MHRVPRVGSLVCIANMKKKKKKNSVKTYDNDLTRTIVVLRKMNSSVVSVVLKCTFYDNVQLKAHLTDVQGI